MLVSVLSVSGAPGVTTLCLALGTTWPRARHRGLPAHASGSDGRFPGSRSPDRPHAAGGPVAGPPALVVESDPAGGVLAARFGLSDRRGWGGLCAEVRRNDGAAVDEFVDVLPGGLPVLVGCRSGERGALRGPVRSRAFDVLVATARDRDVIVDLGRFDPELEAGDRVLSRSDRVVVLVQPDVGALVRLCDRAGRLRSSAEDAVGIVLRGRGPYARGAIARASGLVVLGCVPDAPGAASALAGERPPTGHLRRSRFLNAAASLAEALAWDQAPPSARGDDSADGSVDDHAGGATSGRNHDRGRAIVPMAGSGTVS